MDTNVDYKNLAEITVNTQEELDRIPLDFKRKNLCRVWYL